jgi:hypothetical protein
MYASTRRFQAFDFHLFRWIARASAAVLVITWLALVIAEAVRSQFDTPSALTIYQGVALAIVFAGYAVGWRNELLGGVIAILGTLAFFAVHVITIGTWPDIAAAWFAAPGVLYLLSWFGKKLSGAPLARRR